MRHVFRGDPETVAFAALAALVAAVALAAAWPGPASSEEALLAEALPSALRDRLPLLGSRDGVAYTVRSAGVASVRDGLLTLDIDCSARVAGVAMSGHVMAAQGRAGVPRWVGPSPVNGLGAGGDTSLAERASNAVGRAVLDYATPTSGKGVEPAPPSFDADAR